jgi:hypothetical protein
MSKHIFLTPEIILYGTQDELNTEFVKEYSQLFESLDLSSIPRGNHGIGATGYDQHAMIKAYIVYAREGYRSVLQLIRELEAKPYFSTYVLGFKDNVIPDDSTFYRFLNTFDENVLLKLCAQVNRAKLKATKTKLNHLAIDAKPIVANAKDNNPKCFVHNLSDKTKYPKRNEESALGFMSRNNDINGIARVIFFWGYKLHLIVDANNDTPLVWKIEQANLHENKVAPDIYKLLNMHYTGCFADKPIQLADKAYDDRKVYEAFYNELKGYSIIASNTRNSKPEKTLASDGSPICDSHLKMKSDGSWYVRERSCLRFKFVCPNNKLECEYRKSDYGCTKTLQIVDPVPGKIELFESQYDKLYPKRQSVERVNAYLSNIGFDVPNHYAMKSIQNLVGFALLAKALSKYHIASLAIAA